MRREIVAKRSGRGKVGLASTNDAVLHPRGSAFYGTGRLAGLAATDPHGARAIQFVHHRLGQLDGGDPDPSVSQRQRYPA